jgi:type II secretory pathway component PulF
MSHIFPLASTQLLAGSSAFAALIWWLVPAAGLFGAIGYVVWVSKYKSKFESETSRSVNQFQRFQESFRETPPVSPQIDLDTPKSDTPH